MPFAKVEVKMGPGGKPGEEETIILKMGERVPLVKLPIDSCGVNFVKEFSVKEEDVASYGWDYEPEEERQKIEGKDVSDANLKAGGNALPVNLSELKIIYIKPQS